MLKIYLRNFRKLHYLKFVAHVRIVIDLVSNVVEEFDDLFGHIVPKNHYIFKIENLAHFR